MDTGSAPTTAFELTLQQYATALDNRLRATREKKWNREGIRPHPLMHPPMAEPKREKRGRRADRKVQRLRRKKLSETPIEQTVVNLSSHVLTTSEMSFLQKGLTFCPTDTHFKQIQFTADLHQFYIRLRLKDYFAEKQTDGSRQESALGQTDLRRHSL